MECIVQGCKINKIVAKSMCSKHYNRNLRYGDVNFVKQNKNQLPICEINNCNYKTVARNLCHGHYARWKKNKSYDFSKSLLREVIKYSDGDICIVSHCNNPAKTRRLCINHYRQLIKHDMDFNVIIPLLDKGCQVCGGIKQLSLDHNHDICSSKKVCEKCFRGILCMPCNTALGSLKDDRERLKNMIKYIDEYNKKLLNK